MSRISDKLLRRAARPCLLRPAPLTLDDGGRVDAADAGRRIVSGQ